LAAEFVLGERTVNWDGKTNAGDPLATGVYFYRLDAAGTTITRKLAIVR